MANMFNEDGTYNKTEWKAGDKITAAKLNKIESSLEAINNNDIDRHVEADSRLDILEERIANTPDNEQMDALEDMVKDNKDAADLAIYEINYKMTFLENKLNQDEADMEVMVAEVKADLGGLHAKDNELSAQLTHIAKVNDNNELNDFFNKIENNTNNLCFGGVYEGKKLYSVRISRMVY